MHVLDNIIILHYSVSQENERSKDLIIENRFHKQIIGSKGEKIREIRDRFNGVQVCVLVGVGVCGCKCGCVVV